MRLVLAAQSSADRDNLSPTSERLVNCYAYPAPEGALAPLCIRAVPAMREFVTLPGPFLRAMARVEESLYVITAGGLYRVNDNGTSSYLAAIPDDANTTMTGHRSGVTITAAGSYFIWDGSTLTQPTGGPFDNAGSVAFLDQFTLISELDGREFQWTEAGLPEDLDGLFFATAEARDDKIVRIIDSAGYLAVLKQHSVELWGNSGAGAENAFIRVQGAVSDRGLRAFNLMAKTPDGVFFIGEDDIAYMGGAGGAQAVSPPTVNIALRAGTPTHCFYYEDRGHALHVIRFSDRPAWVYDASMGLWHERSTGPEHKPWDVIAAVKVYGQWHLGDIYGHVFRLSTTPEDAAGPLRRTIVARPLTMDGLPFSVAKLELMGLFGNYSVTETAPNWETDQNGFPITDEDGAYILLDGEHDATTWARPGRIWLRLSKDGGHTFGIPKTKDIGRKGDYAARARWFALGQFDSLVVEINLTDPVDVPLLSEALVEVS